MSDNWSTLLQFARAEGAQPVPKEFKSFLDLQKQFSLGETQTKKVIRKLIDAGKIERKDFRIQTRAGVRAVPHYRAIK